ncbi:hypothetical protein TWF694_001956 [Orbilia ellipsospora]|uniref:WSC domain-containing protein n=1 Tax=Orbilia ellipsospora TaxID=2528407 RepID=A0AAV9X475_9PEZI
MLATSALAVPSALVPRSGALQKRTYPPVWYFPPYNGTFAPWKPIGCYSGDTALTYNTGMCSCQNAAWKTGPMPFSMEKCFAYCKSAGFRFAGIKGAAQAKSCWCGNGVTDDDKLSNESKCNVPCEAGEGGKDYDPNKCGGSTTYTVYKDPCYKDYDGDAEIVNYEYVGCFYYYDATILGYYIGVQSDNLSVDSCIEHCAGKGFAYAGMSASAYSAYDVRGDQCWCGGKIADAWITRHKAYPIDNNQCTVLCSATKKVYSSIPKEDYQYCGGAWYMSIYFNGNLAMSDTCEVGPPKSTITTTTPGPTPGTSTIPGTSTDTVVITVTQPHSTTTVSTPGSTEGTTTKTGPSTDTVIITTTVQHVTITVTTPGPSSGTTTVTGPTTDTVIITTPVPHDTTTITTPGPTPGTTTKTGPSTDTVIITTPPHETVTVTTPGPTPGTTTKTGPSTDTVIITTPAPHDTTTVITTGPTPGTTTKTGPSTDTVFITTSADHFTITVTTPGPTDGTTTKTGPLTDTVIITTPVEHDTITITTPGPTEGTTTKTGSLTDTVIITTPAEHVTVTVSTPGPTEGTTTKTGPSTDTVIITTTPNPSVDSVSTHYTVTITTPGPSEGTTTKTGPTTDTVIITEPAEHETTTITTPGSVPGTTTKTGPSTDTVIITVKTTPSYGTGKVTITETTPGPTPGTTTKTGPSTDTVVITTPTAGPSSPHVTTTVSTPGSVPGTTTKTGPSTDTVIITVQTTPENPTGKVTITQTTPGPNPGTTTKTGPSTDTVIITTPTAGPSSPHPTVTQSTPGPSPGTSTITGSKTDTVVITTTTPAGPTGSPPPDSCCVMPNPSNNDRGKGIRYPLGGFKPSVVYTSDKKSYTLVKLSGITSTCRTSYKYTIDEFQAACWNGCVEQQKKCYASYTTQTVCNRSGNRKICFTKSDLKTQCDVQFSACKSANTNTNRRNNPLKDAMNKCPDNNNPEDPAPSLVWADILSDSERDYDMKWGKYNPQSEKAIIKILDRANQRQVPPDNICVTTMHARQSELIRKAIRRELPDYKIKVDTVDGFQGGKHEYVIVDLVRSNHRGDMGFLREGYRVNVAITRAMTKCIIVGDLDFYERASFFERNSILSLRTLARKMKEDLQHRVLPAAEKEEVEDSEWGSRERFTGWRDG